MLEKTILESLVEETVQVNGDRAKILVVVQNLGQEIPFVLLKELKRVL